MSENDLRFASGGGHRWPSVPVATSQTLSEVEEGVGGVGGVEAARANRKKTPPPPRPPPPKWEQFHRRRASHHALFASSPPPGSTPPSMDAAESRPRSSSCVPPPETSRLRSYSLPPERWEVAEGCPRCSCSRTRELPHASSNQNPPLMQEQHYSHASSNQNQAQPLEVAFTVAPPSPMFSRRSFRPVAPPPKERDQKGMYGEQQERVEVRLPPPPAPPAEISVSR